MVNILEKNSSYDPTFTPDQKMIVEQVFDENSHRSGGTMVVLNEPQSKIGFVSETMQVYFAKKLKVPVSSVHGVVSFYSFFTTKPRGRHTIKSCMGTACYIGGAEQLFDKARQIIGIDSSETTQDNSVTLEICHCVGACSQAPLIVVDDETYGRVKPNKFPQIIKGVQEKDTQEIKS